ncbi:hypothetical protein L917_15164 [Phytophthora nicotianae]|uniref:Uncharacterized protein n=1 Tax=Phytophthora nicotianae TaxID=4792 RepID=W2KLP8_PHYNI|nr:hypothetical protein L917_15164 [Phytophthora nicotianae]
MGVGEENGEPNAMPFFCGWKCEERALPDQLLVQQGESGFLKAEDVDLIAAEVFGGVCPVGGVGSWISRDQGSRQLAGLIGACASAAAGDLRIGTVAEATGWSWEHDEDKEVDTEFDCCGANAETREGLTDAQEHLPDARNHHLGSEFREGRHPNPSRKDF